MDSGNDYLGALKGNQSGLLKEVETHFRPEQTDMQINKGHGRIEKRTVSICQSLQGIRDWPGLLTIIRVESERQLLIATLHRGRDRNPLLYRFLSVTLLKLLHKGFGGQ